MNVLRVYRYGLLVGRQEFLLFWGWQSWFGGWLVRMVAQVAFFSLIGQLLDSPERLRFLLIGNSVVVGALAANWAVPASTWDRGNGTYPLLVIAPSSLLPAIVGRTSIWLANGVATSVGAFLVLGAVFDLALPWPGTLSAVLLIVLTCASTYCMALFLGSLVTRAPRIRNIIHTTATIALTTFSGVSVPVAFWPGWVEAIAHVLPLTHGLHAVRLALDRGDPLEILQSAGLEIVVGLGWLLLSLMTIDRMANAGRADGSIEFV